MIHVEHGQEFVRAKRRRDLLQSHTANVQRSPGLLFIRVAAGSVYVVDAVEDLVGIVGVGDGYSGSNRCGASHGSGRASMMMGRG